MKKRFFALLTAALTATLLFTSCAESSTGSSTDISNPFDNTTVYNPLQNSTSSVTSSEVEQDPVENDDYTELFGKYQTGSSSYSEFSISNEAPISYNGGEIEVSFKANTNGNPYDIEEGYMAFINGVPQKLSLNGGEKSELVRISMKPDTDTEITLSFTPQITEELKDEETLQLLFFKMFNPSYQPSGQYLGFGNAHSGMAFCARSISVEAPIEVVDMEENAYSQCESLLITNELKEEYGITKENSPTKIHIRAEDKITSNLFMSEGTDTTTAVFRMNGIDTYKYKIYVYVNHERVSFNGGYNCIIAENKIGYICTTQLQLEGIKDRDIVYAIALPYDYGMMLTANIKSDSVLVLGEADGAETSDRPDASAESTEEVPPVVDEFPNDTGRRYGYIPIAYINDEQTHLLMRKELGYSDENHNRQYEYVIYDETTQLLSQPVVSGAEGRYVNWCDDTITFTNLFIENQNICVYNSKMELIKRMDRQDGGPASLTYIPSSGKFLGRGSTITNDKKGLCIFDCELSPEKLIFEHKNDNTEPFIVKYTLIGDDRIACYISVYMKKDIFAVLDFDGNTLYSYELDTKGYGNCVYGVAGDYVYLAPGYQNGYTYEMPSGKILFYNTKTEEVKIITTVTKEESSLLGVSPDGNYFVTASITDESTVGQEQDILMRAYDIESGEVVATFEEHVTRCISNVYAYTDRIYMFAGVYRHDYEFKYYQ